MSATPPSPRAQLDGVEQVVADTLRFKAKLAIGENAYASLRAVNRMRELWDVLGAAGTGAAIAKSSLVASTFFAPSGLLGVLGIGTAATPIGWVAFAAVASGGACYGLYRLLGRSKESRIIEIPRYLNTPLDALGLALFDLLAPLAIRLAAVDGVVSDAERERLVQHLVADWGLDPAFVSQALALVEPEAVAGSLEAMASEAASFLHANPDCNHEAIAREYVEFLRDLLETDGMLTVEEETALAMLSERLMSAPPSSLSQQWTKAKEQAGAVADQVKDAVTGAARWTREKLPTPAVPSVDTAEVVARVQDKTKAVGRQVGAAVDQLSQSTRGLFDRITRRGLTELRGAAGRGGPAYVLLSRRSSAARVRSFNSFPAPGTGSFDPTSSTRSGMCFTIASATPFGTPMRWSIA